MINFINRNRKINWTLTNRNHAVLLYEKGKKFFLTELNETATAIWILANGKFTQDDIVNFFREKTHLDDRICSEVKDFIDKILKKGFLIKTTSEVKKTSSFENVLEKYFTTKIQKPKITAMHKTSIRLNYSLIEKVYFYLSKYKPVKQLIYPEKVVLDLTYRCNLNCIYCYNFNRRCNSSNQYKSFIDYEPSTSKIKKIIDRLAESKIKFINFSGGECFLRNDIFEIIKYATGKGMEVKITTNGTLLNEDKITRLKRINPNLLLEFGLEGISPKGNNVNVLRNIRLAKKNGLPVEVNSMANKLSFKDIFRVQKLIRKLNVDILLIFPIHRTEIESSISLTYYQNILFQVYTFILKKIYKFKSTKKNFLTFCYECEAFSYPNIDTHGNVHFCAHIPKTFPLGNIFKQDLIEIWHSNNYIRLFDYTQYKEPCKNCLFKNTCSIYKGCRAEIYSATGDFFAGNPYCLRGKISSTIHKIL